MRFVELKKRLAARSNLPLLLVFLVLLAACSGDRESSTSYEGFEARKHPTPQVILITVDTLRADALSSYHPQGGPTPSVDRLAEDGVLFNHVMAVAPWTLPSLASLLTGVAPNVHGAVGRESVVPNDLPTLAEYMRDAGYLTAGLGSNPYLRPRSGLSRGFLRYDIFPKEEANSLLEKFKRWRSPTPSDPSTAELTDMAVQWIQANHEKDFFLWVHYLDPHTPYAPPQEFLPQAQPLPRIGTSFGMVSEILGGTFVPSLAERAWIKELYRAEVRYIDESLGRLIDTLKRLNLYRDSLIVFTSDHGEEFWEHGTSGHGHTLYDEVLRVPLILKLPQSASTRRINTLVANAGLMPTILDLCEIPYSEEMFSYSSLRTSWESRTHPSSAQSIYSTRLHYYEDREAIVFEGMKYVRLSLSRKEELYDLTQDPEEQFSVVRSNPDIVREAKYLLDEQARQAERLRKHYGVTSGEAKPLDPETEEQLQSLGYVK